MNDRNDVLRALSAMMPFIARLGLDDPAAAEAALEERFPTDSLDSLGRQLCAASDAGWLCPREATPTLRFGRVSKPVAETAGLSVDVVDMAGAGAAHTHPRGEVSLCFVREGEPRFDGGSGWVVKAPGSHHVPTVEGGRMLIVYFLPGGAMTWGASSDS